MSLPILTIQRTAPKISLRRSRYLSISGRRSYDTHAPDYEVNIAAEPLHKYRPGGYHPIHIGDQFKYGRYRITHKLGWGGEGTVWLARDLRASTLVALKVLVADESGRNEEAALLKRLFSGAGSPDHPGTDHLTQLRDSFWHTGSNGTHECLVFDISGTNAQDQARQYAAKRVPARAAWSVAKQLVLAVDRLHAMNVTHADIHTRNVMLSPSPHHYTNTSLLPMLPKAHVADVNALPPNELNQFMPKYLVEATALPFALTDPGIWHAQLVDFGQSYHASSTLKQSRTPLVLRAPELILFDTWDHRIDIWSLGCTIFELITGQPPFDPVGASQNRLIQEWIGMFGDLPEGWRSPWGYTTQWGDDEEIGVTTWLKQCYFQGIVQRAGSEEKQEAVFSEEELDCAGDLIEQLLKYRPEERLDTEAILKHKWFAQGPFPK